jgi:hypothetical protein
MIWIVWTVISTQMRLIWSSKPFQIIMLLDQMVLMDSSLRNAGIL